MFGGSFDDKTILHSLSDCHGQEPDTLHGISLQCLSGNSSREPDSVLRCMSLKLAGDFYVQGEYTVKRGISLPGSISTSSEAGCKSRSLPEDIDGDKLTHCCNQDMKSGWLLGSGTSILEEYVDGRDMLAETNKDFANQHVTREDRFVETSEPPTLPADGFFELEATTFYVSNKPACDICNHVLDFFSRGVVASIRAVNTSDYSIEADAFVNNVMCTVQVSVYNCDSRGFAFEFQRLAGAVPEFHAVYQKATSWVEGLRLLVENSSNASPEINFLAPHNVPGEAPLVDQETLTPLYDMASLQTPSLQSEAAVALANLADDGFASQLCNKSIFDAIANLLKTEAPEVAYPTYHLILSLAQQAEAAMFFTASLLTIIIDRLSKSANAIVRDELARAFEFALQHQESKSMQIVDLECKFNAALDKWQTTR